MESVMESENILSWKGVTRIKTLKFRELYKRIIRSETQITDRTVESRFSTFQATPTENKNGLPRLILSLQSLTTPS